MKNWKFVNIIIGLFLIATLAHAQDTKEVKAGYYLTVGAYAKSKEAYAKKYRDKVREMGFDAQYDFFPKKNYYMVYIKRFDDFNTSIRELYVTRKNTDFKDCWVYVLRQSELVSIALNKEVQGGLSDMFAERFKDSNDDNQESNENAITNESSDVVSESQVEENRITEPDEVIANVNSTSDEATTVGEKPSNSPDQIVEEDAKHIFFSLFNGTNSKEVQGQVEVIDANRLKTIRKYDGNTVIKMKDPENGNGDLIIISDVFGYKKVQHDFNYLEPHDDEETPYVTNIGDTIVVNFELARYTKGDIATMYNVFFFKDASIMKPESKYELNQLVEMLKENPSMKIRIHGHTNGNAAGKIIALEEGSDKYFSLEPTNNTSVGSAKKLSKERAMIIKRYLEAQGITRDHTEIKAWGGKAKIHHKHSSQAHKNVRVEIEVLQD